jgi:predicted NAD/FAD-binding protein
MDSAKSMVTDGTRKRVAVVGAGISGITAAFLLSEQHDVVLFERKSAIGGHTNTIVVADGPDAGTPVDTGFIVCNPVNYTHFYQFLDLLGVPRRNSEMTFGCYIEATGLHYRGPDLKDILRAPRNFLSPSFCKMLLEQRRFNRCALSDLSRGTLGEQTLGDYVRSLGLSHFFVTHYLVPLAASIWSSPDANILAFPAVTFLTFFRNHGMLELHKRPQWQTVVGGSHAYLRAFERCFRGTIRTDALIERIERRDAADSVQRAGGAVTLFIRGEPEEFDSVVLACHADEALTLLAEPSQIEQEALGSWRYHRNRTILHTDTSLMPPRRHLWASWNYILRGPAQSNQEAFPEAPVSITYSMNRLQGLRTRHEYLVTLNPSQEPRPDTVVYETLYTHPEYTSRSVASQNTIQSIQGQRNTYFCGAHLGYGFHEDGVVSALAVARHWGINRFNVPSSRVS